MPEELVREMVFMFHIYRIADANNPLNTVMAIAASVKAPEIEISPRFLNQMEILYSLIIDIMLNRLKRSMRFC